MPYLAEERREKFRCVKPLVAAPPLTPRSRGSQWSGGGEQRDVHLTMWPSGDRRLIAQASFHGRDVRIRYGNFGKS